jgi:hypothetical protein
MEGLECPAWSYGDSGCGLKVLGGVSVRRANFNPKQSPVLVEITGTFYPCEVKKKSLWRKTCGELINRHFRSWFQEKGLHTGDRVRLEILEPYKKLRAVG